MGGARSVSNRAFLFCFFSSRRRHTRCLSDWSSDVCSSDLEEIDHYRSVADGQQPGRSGAAVPVLAPCVERRPDHRARFPLHGLPGAARRPNVSFALATDDVDDLLEQVALRIGLAARWNLTEIAIVDALAANQID